MKTLEKLFAEKLLKIKAIKLQPANPFTWASGWKSPFYCDNRKTLSYPSLRNFVKLEISRIVLEKFGQTTAEPDLEAWKGFLDRLGAPKSHVTVALVGKYVELQDAYKSIREAFVHAGAANECRVNVQYIHSENLNEANVEELLGKMNGILVAPGFGERGLEGKVVAIRYAREKGIPFFGICLGMQMCVVEFARDVLGMDGACSTEVNPNATFPVINLMEDQKSTTSKGGTMRLGAYDCEIKPGSLAEKIYGTTKISERHRHRYELNSDFLGLFEKAGLIASGRNPDTRLVEIVELRSHPFFIGVQFHPEYKSTPENPQPIFVAFIKAAMKNAEGSAKKSEPKTQEMKPVCAKSL